MRKIPPFHFPFFVVSLYLILCLALLKVCLTINPHWDYRFCVESLTQLFFAHFYCFLCIFANSLYLELSVLIFLLSFCRICMEVIRWCPSAIVLSQITSRKTDSTTSSASLKAKVSTLMIEMRYAVPLIHLCLSNTLIPANKVKLLTDLQINF